MDDAMGFICIDPCRELLFPLAFPPQRLQVRLSDRTAPLDLVQQAFSIVLT